MAEKLVMTLTLISHGGVKLCWNFGLLYVEERNRINWLWKKRNSVPHHGRIILNYILGTGFKELGLTILTELQPTANM